MAYNPSIHNRKSIRLKGYDYSQAGLYFITICVQGRELLFGKIVNDEIILNDAGKMIQTEWEKLPQRFSNIELDEFIVMPNHFHAILEIVTPSAVTAVGATLVVAPNATGAPNVIEIPDINEASNVVETQNDDVAQNEIIFENFMSQSRSGATTRVAPTVVVLDKTVGKMVAAFKSITTVEYIHGVANAGWQPFNGKLWQRNYYEHIIRNERSYENISDYITGNAARWQDDKFYRC